MTKKEKDLIAENKMLMAQVETLRALLRGIEDFCRRESQKPPTDAADAAVSETCSHVGQQIRAALVENNDSKTS